MSMQGETINTARTLAMPAISGLAAGSCRAVMGAARRNRLLLVLIALHFGITLGVGKLSGVPYDPGTFAALSELFYGLLPIFLAVIVIARFIAMVRSGHRGRPLPWLIADLKRLALAPGRVVDGVVTLLALSVFTGSYGYFKEIIPHLVPFSLDPTLSHLDRVIHGGTLPYVWLMGLFGNPYLITLFNTVYQGWFFVMFFTVFLAVFTVEDRASRNTFLVGFVLVWGLGGNVLATLLSSAGPVYYARLGFGHDYDALNATLAAFNHISPNWSLDAQKWLWEGYLGKGPIRGISAMPSMHAASTTILMLYGYRLGPIVGRALTLFWGMICIAAVLLAWHYAVDVYAGVALGLAFWWVAAALTGDRAFGRRAGLGQGAAPAR